MELRQSLGQGLARSPARAEAGPEAADLQAVDLGVRFGGHVAVDRVSCRFLPGSTTAIVGPNGAGKTTFFNLLSGQLAPSSGRVLLGGRDVTAASAARRARLGIGRAFQLTNLFPALTVFENIRLVVQARCGIWLDMLSLWSGKRAVLQKAEEVLERVHLQAARDRLAGSLPHGDQRKLEVALLLALDPQVLMFDEPTAGMSLDDVPIVLDLIRSIKQARDRTILLVEHKMDVIQSLADEVMVMHNGALLAKGAPSEVMALDVVQQAYLGNWRPA